MLFAKAALFRFYKGRGIVSKKVFAAALSFLLCLSMASTAFAVPANNEQQSNAQQSATGSLVITKEVAGSGAPAKNTQFEFTVTKDSVAASGNYCIDDGDEQPIPAEGKISLQAGQSATLTGLEPGEYTVTETQPSDSNYDSTSFSVNGQAAEKGLSAAVTVVASADVTAGGWYMKGGQVARDSDGYLTYTITQDQIDGNGKIVVDCDPLAEYIEAYMQAYQNYSPRGFKVRFINKTGVSIQYEDYSFSTVNWIPAGAAYTPLANPSMMNTNDAADENSAGYGWGDVWQQYYPMVAGQSLVSTTLSATGFDGNGIRLSMAPMRCINPAIISYFKSNPGKDAGLTGNSTIKNASDITLLQMNKFPTLIKQAFTFENYQGDEVSLPADSSRTYADFICAFYNVSSLDDLTSTQMYNVLGTGHNGSPGITENGQAGIWSYYANLNTGSPENWCIPYTALNNGSLDYFKTWGFSNARIEAGKKLISGGKVFTEADAQTYAYQQSYYLMESDPEVAAMGYKYLYDRCMRLSFDTDNRAIFTGSDEYSPAEDPSSIKSYIDKTEAANANMLAAMNGGAEVADNQSITLDKVRGFIEVPNAWNQLRYYDFGFDITFKTDASGGGLETASVTFTNNYVKPSVPPADSDNPAKPNNSSETAKADDVKQSAKVAGEVLPQMGDSLRVLPLAVFAVAGVVFAFVSLRKQKYIHCE